MFYATPRNVFPAKGDRVQVEKGRTYKQFLWPVTIRDSDQTFAENLPSLSNMTVRVSGISRAHIRQAWVHFLGISSSEEEFVHARTRMFALGAATGLAMLSGAAAGFTAQGAEPATTTSAAPSPLDLVEDYSYPGADAVFEQYDVRLISGDGNILLAECDSEPDLIEVYSRELPQQVVCFDVRGSEGYLRMELPAVYAIGADDHSVEATITVENQTKVVDVAEGDYTPVGEGTDPESGPATLLELTATS